MAENKWIVDGHHYTCPDCKKTIAIVVNESDEDFEFCPFCGKRMSSQMAENKMSQVAAIFDKKLGEEFIVNEEECRKNLICKITERGLFFYHSSYEAWWQDSGLLSELITGEAVIVDD